MTEEWKIRIRQYRKLWKSEPELLAVTEYLLADKEEAQKESVMSEVTVYVTAPLLCAYVAWVVKNAAKTGKKRLYFLARDGYFMKEVAELFCRMWQLNVECRYLYCSRYAWRGAVYHMNIEEALDYITLGGLEVSFQKMMLRAGLCKEEAAEVAAQLGYTTDTGKILLPEERKILRKQLSECQLFMQLMVQHSKEKYRNTIAYLEQEGLMSTLPYALVDSGWTGSLQKSLLKLLKSAGCTMMPEGYYFGMYSRYPEKEAGRYHTYYFSPERDIRRKVYFNNNVFECIYSAPHGMTTGYEQKDEIWQPVFEQKESPNKERLLSTEQLLLGYAGLYALHCKNGMDAESERWEKQEQKRLERLLRLFMGRPTREEAREYGSFVFCDDVIGEETQTLAGGLSREELKNGFLLAKIQKRLGKRHGKQVGNRAEIIKKEKLSGSNSPGRESAWPEGSVALVMGRKGFWHCALCAYVRLGLETWKNRRKEKS